MDYDRAYQDLDKILTATNYCRENKLDTVFANGQPVATTTHGEALRPLIRDEAAFAMEDFGLSALEAVQMVVEKIRNAGADELYWWKQNGWLKEVIR